MTLSTFSNYKSVATSADKPKVSQANLRKQTIQISNDFWIPPQISSVGPAGTDFGLRCPNQVLTTSNHGKRDNGTHPTICSVDDCAAFVGRIPSVKGNGSTSGFP